MIEQKLLKEFFYHPQKKWGIRELGRKTKLDTKTVMKYLKEFISKKIIVKNKENNHFSTYSANIGSIQYHYEKKTWLLRKIIQSGLIDHLENTIHPKTIVIFGSVQKGDYHEKSDVDLFVQAPYTKLELFQFKRKIGHEISILFEKNTRNLGKGILNNILHGEILTGTFYPYETQNI